MVFVVPSSFQTWGEMVGREPREPSVSRPRLVRQGGYLRRGANVQPARGICSSRKKMEKTSRAHTASKGYVQKGKDMTQDSYLAVFAWIFNRLL